MKKAKVTLISFNWADHFSLANGCLKAYAEKDRVIAENADIQIVDFDAEDHDVRQALYYLSRERPDIVGFSSYCWNMDKILELSRLLKQLDPRTKIILGGPEVGPIARKCMTENPAVDVVVMGEGEATFQELLRSYLDHGKPMASVKGITYRQDGKICSTEQRPLMDDLGDIPSPYLTGILTPRDKVTYLETYRGCPYRCAFCFEGKNFPKLRFFPEERIRREIELVTSNPNISTFHVVDSVFNLKKSRLRRIAQMFNEANRSGAGLTTVEVMAELVDEETVELLKKANVLSVETGPQTVNADTIKNISRYYRKEKFNRGIKLLLDGGIEVLTDLIIGLPGDNFFRFLRSAKAMIQLKPTTIVFSILHVLPGTELYENADKFGLLFDEKAPHMVLQNDTFPYDEIDKAVVLAVSMEREFNLRIQ
ncbi:MAG: B12-binding domain-containing radical SAM protein [Deltaproteobacteria bacterium]|nr:B12-binding domain-containing radical SAM protein [Deltaproteobacteria bacterium]